jgi:two-component system chemotaxis response regulator CheB
VNHKINKVLLIDDEPDILDFYDVFFQSLGIRATMCDNAKKAAEQLRSQDFDLVISDIHMPKKTGIALMEEMRQELDHLPRWFFVSAHASPEMVEKACALGAIDVLTKPFDIDDLKLVIERAQNQISDPLHEVMDVVQSVSGVQLGKDKKKLVETRLLRRSRLLGLKTAAEYLTFFKEHRKDEVKELISIVTTHTTEFFREPDHFDYLYDRVFPLLLKEREVTFWSAASSTGPEIYSIAIAWCEFLAERGMKLESGPRVKFIATDIDFASLETAAKGIYAEKWLVNVNEKLKAKYFDVGEGNLKGLVKIKDFIHQRCQFEQKNLLSNTFPYKNVDVIFLRNVLIYFKPKDIESIVTQLEASLKSNGILFIGHSESLSNLNTPYKLIGNSVYQSKRSVISLIPEVSTITKSGKIRVLIVDDSLTIRRMITKILNEDPAFEIAGEAVNPIEADKFLKNNSIDVMTLDVHMPEMDGVTYLENLKQRQVDFQIVMVSSTSYDDAVGALRCFDLGAVDYIEKPQNMNLGSESERIRTVLKSAMLSKKSKINQKNIVRSEKSVQAVQYGRKGSKDLILIGASTGGVHAIRDVVIQFPEVTPPILIVQHIPEHFSKAFAKRLNDLCKIKVVEAVNGEIAESSTAYIAPGNRQLGVKREGSHFRLHVTDDPPMSRHKPSVDYLFESVAKEMDKSWDIVACILTGMGSDGANGMKQLKDKGVHTIAQNEETCVVFGMPQKAIEKGGIIEILPLTSIPYHIFKAFGQTYSSKAV